MKIYNGLNAVHSVVNDPHNFQKTTFPSECEDICLSLADCEMAVWHESTVNHVWGNVCVTLSFNQMLDLGRLHKESWVEQAPVTTMVKHCQ